MMDRFTATEVAYKNGYKAGYEQGYKDAWEHPTMKIYKLVLDPDIMVAYLDIALNDNMRQTIPVGWCYKDIIKNEQGEKKKGKWILHRDGSGTCDQCRGTANSVWDYDSYQNYCGRCGAEMSI